MDKKARGDFSDLKINVFCCKVGAPDSKIRSDIMEMNTELTKKDNEAVRESPSRVDKWYWCGVCAVFLFMTVMETFAREGESCIPLILPVIIAVLLGVSLLMCKVKGWCLFPRASELIGLSALAVVYACCCNVWAYEYPDLLYITIFQTMGVMMLLWWLLRYGTIVVWAPFLLLQFIQIAAYFQYGTQINSLVIAEALEASEQEIATYVTLLNIVALIGVLVLVGVLIWLQIKLLKRIRSKVAIFNAGLLFALTSVVGAMPVPKQAEADGAFWPVMSVYRLGESIHDALYHNYLVIKIVEELSSPAEQPSSISTLQGNENVVFVLHVGESVRADHMSLNGYERDTTPWLKSQVEQGNLINYTDCISAACDTCQAQIAILTNARRDIYATEAAMQASTGSVLDLFAANGFKVYTFFGRSAGQQLKYDRVVRMLTKCSVERFNAEGSPWTSVPQMETILDEQPQGTNLLIFINNEGSHAPFAHFDDDSAPFMPANREFENPRENGEQIKNAYDNTIHYTDEFIRRVVASLEGRPFIYVYVSDHGEYLGHDGMWGRGALGDNNVRYHDTDGCRVGMFIITSPEFRKLHPHFVQALEQLRAHADMRVGHEHIFHTLLGMFGIATPYYDKQLDLTSDAVLPYTGPAPQKK